MFQFSTKFAITGALFSWCSWLPWVLYLLCKTTLLVLLAGGEVGFLTYIWSGTFTSPTVINSHALPASRTLDNLMGPGDGNIISGWQGLASLNPFVLSCTILDKFYCLTIQDWVRSVEEQEQNTRTRRNMNWSDGSVLVDCGTQIWGTCFSTVCKLEFLSEENLSFFCLNVGD